MNKEGPREVRSRAVNRTIEQNNYVASLLKKRPERTREKQEINKPKTDNRKASVIKKLYAGLEEVPEDPIMKRIYYLNNCNFWQNQYKQGLCDKDRLLASLRNTAILANELIKIMNT